MRKTAGKQSVNLDVWTGGYQVLSLNNATGEYNITRIIRREILFEFNCEFLERTYTYKLPKDRRIFNQDLERLSRYSLSL